MNNCIFCKIINKEIQSQIVYEDDDCIGFKDINPVSPVHVLFIPRKHIESLNSISEEDTTIMGKILLKIAKYAREKGLEKNGYRVVNNIGKDAGQTVFHIHFHLLAGRGFHWPPG